MRHRRSSGRSSVRGFTLLELILVIVLSGIVAVIAGRFVAQPVDGYLDVTRRAELVDVADTALHRMTRETRTALTNSMRVSAAGDALEFLRVLTGGRYRAIGADELDFTAASDSFDVIGTLADAGSVDTDPSAGLADCVAGSVDCLVIYNTGQSGASAYAQDNMAAIQAAAPGSVTFSGAPPFPFTSPGQRFYVVDTPVSYLCDVGAGTLVRYAEYPITALHSAVDSAAELTGAGASSALLAEQVTSCAFSYQAGTATRGGLVSLRLTVASGGESVTLLQQVHVTNLP
jgi:MSHA biogenesis protein MshO